MDAQKRMQLYLEDRGCIVHGVSRPAAARFHARTPVDVFGIIDLVVLTPRRGVLYFQVCTDNGATAHRRKIEGFLREAIGKGISRGSVSDLIERLVLAIWRTKKKTFTYQVISLTGILEAEKPVFIWQGITSSSLD